MKLPSSAMVSPPAMMGEAQHQREAISEGFDPTSPAIAPAPVARGDHTPDDDSPPPTHFVEITLPPVVAAETQRPTLPETSIAQATATAPPAEPAPAPAVAAMPMPAAQPAPALARISLELPPDSDLVLVETSQQRAEPPMPEGPEAARPHRVRPPRVEVSEGPLQMVETVHKEPPPPGA